MELTLLALLALLVGVAIFALWIWALVDIIRSTFSDIAIKVVWFLLVFFLPLIGFILYVIIGKSTKVSDNALQTNQKYDDLQRLKSLHQSGALTDEEYESEKQKILLRD